MEPSSPFVEHQPFQLNLLLSEFQLDQLHGSDGDKDSRTERRREDCGKVKADFELGLTCLCKFFHCAKSDRVKKPRGYSRHRVKMIGQVQGDLAQENSIKTQRRSQAWQKDAVLDESTRRLVATEEDQEHLNFLEDPKSTRRLVASGNADTKGKDNIWPHNLHISTDGEGFLHCETKIWSQYERQSGKFSI